MELYEQILESKDPSALAKMHKSTLKKEYKLLNKTMMGIWMTMNQKLDYQKELNDLEVKLDKIDTCLSYTQKR